MKCQNLFPGDNFHLMSKPVFWENKKKYFKVFSAEIFTQSAMCLCIPVCILHVSRLQSIKGNRIMDF